MDESPLGITPILQFFLVILIFQTDIFEILIDIWVRVEIPSQQQENFTQESVESPAGFVKSGTS